MYENIFCNNVLYFTIEEIEKAEHFVQFVLWAN